EFQNNIAVSGTWCFTVSPEGNLDSLEIFGENGVIKTSTFSFEPIRLENENGVREFKNDRPENVQYFLIEQIVKSLTTGSEVVSTGTTAARTSRVMDEVVRSYYKK
ncbi:MAG: gfo/Idh/MocA family oxidoreductase, partial [Bacteroidales bacterium]